MGIHSAAHTFKMFPLHACIQFMIRTNNTVALYEVVKYVTDLL